jgi:hypothetical protein
VTFLKLIFEFSPPQFLPPSPHLCQYLTDSYRSLKVVTSALHETRASDQRFQLFGNHFSLSPAGPAGVEGRDHVGASNRAVGAPNPLCTVGMVRRKICNIADRQYQSCAPLTVVFWLDVSQCEGAGTAAGPFSSNASLAS